MVEIEGNLNKTDHKSIRYCGNCKREYTFDNFMLNYPNSYRDQGLKLWYNQEIKFYCSYCYLLKIIKKINKEKKSIG
jgi:hypothetical protein